MKSGKKNTVRVKVSFLLCFLLVFVSPRNIKTKKDLSLLFITVFPTATKKDEIKSSRREEKEYT